MLFTVDMLRALQGSRLGHALERKRALRAVLNNLRYPAKCTLAKQLALCQRKLVRCCVGWGSGWGWGDGGRRMQDDEEEDGKK